MSKPYHVGNIETGMILGSFASVLEARALAEENERDYLVFHESHRKSLGMRWPSPPQGGDK